MALVKLQNLNRDHQIEVRSFDGDSVTLPPGSTHDVDEKFLWNLPHHVREVKTPGAVQVKVMHKVEEKKVVQPDSSEAKPKTDTTGTPAHHQASSDETKK